MSPSPVQSSSTHRTPANAVVAPEVTAGTQPRSLARRLGLLAVLFILPVLAVSVPVMLIGQRPPPGQGANAWAGFGALRVWWSGRSASTSERDANAPGFENLRESLNKSAQTQLPDSSASLAGPGEITLPASDDAAIIDTRFAALTRLAERLAGSAAEKPADAAGRHLFVTLPTAGGKRVVFESLATRNLDLVVATTDAAELDKLIAVASAANPASVAINTGAQDFLTVSVAAARP